MLIFYVEGAHERTRQRKHSPLYTLWDGGRVKKRKAAAGARRTDRALIVTSTERDRFEA